MNLTWNNAYESAPKTKKNHKNVDISQTSSKEYIHPFVKEPVYN